MIRQPAVAGRFYPLDPVALADVIGDVIDSAAPRTEAIGALIPHAGYVYSGPVAGAIFSRLEIPGRIIILCPNHTGLGPPLSIMKSGIWRTPLGDVTIDEELSAALMLADPGLENDVRAHEHEHAVEVQLPFLQYLAQAERIRFVPITMGTGNWSDLAALGDALARTIRAANERILIIASSDMNHYESDRTTKIKDKIAIDRVLDLDARGLYDVVQRERISMCGFGPATAMLMAAKQLGAGHAELIKYGTSGETSGDFERVVGYAGITVFP